MTHTWCSLCKFHFIDWGKNWIVSQRQLCRESVLYLTTELTGMIQNTHVLIQELIIRKQEWTHPLVGSALLPVCAANFVMCDIRLQLRSTYKTLFQVNMEICTRVENVLPLCQEASSVPHVSSDTHFCTIHRSTTDFSHTDSNPNSGWRGKVGMKS